MDEKVINKVVKDFNIPIPIYEEPYFSYYVCLYDKHFQIKKRLEMVENFATSEEFFNWLDNKKDEILKTVKELKVYQDFTTMDMTTFGKITAYPKGNLYSMANDGQTFISLDLVKANYQALRFVNPEIVLNSKNYGEFINNFSTHPYLKESKGVRQFLFGNLNPKRQSTIERYLIAQVIQYLINKGYISEDNIVNVFTDEIILSSMLKDLTNIESLEKEIFENLNIEVKIGHFKLDAIVSQKNNKCYGYTKTFIHPFDKEVEFKAIQGEYFPQVFKWYYKLPITEKDLLFYHNGDIARFLNPIF